MALFPDAHIKGTCSRDHISIGAEEDFFAYHNVPLESVHLPNKSCRAQREVLDGVAYYVSRLSKDAFLSCGGKLLVVQLESYLLPSTAVHFM